MRLKDGRSLRNSTMLFHDFAAHDAGQGEKIWFPNRVIRVAYNGVIEDGSPLECWREEFLVKKIEFDTEIPDSVFQLEIPRHAKVYDDVTGLGWLPPTERPAAVFPEEARARRRWVAFAAALAAAAALGAVVWHRRRARRLKATP